MSINLTNLTGTVHVAPDRDRLFDDLAAMLIKSAFDAVQQRGEFHIALSGGSTPEPFYMQLVTDPRYRMIPWDKTHVWIVDERRVPENHEQSNIRMIRESLLDHVVIEPRQIHPMPVLADDPVGEYEAELRSVFGCEMTLPRIDFVLLGMGDDCHTASLFPHSPAIDVKDRWIAVNEGEHVTPPPRVTMTYPLLNAGRYLAVLITGAKKAAAIRRVAQQMAKAPDPANLPITGIDPSTYENNPGRFTWFLEEAVCQGEESDE